jgi:hypothetical protein
MVSNLIRTAAVLLISAGTSLSALAAQATWTELPGSSTTWEHDPYFGALSNNPWDIFSGATSVAFIGFQHPGGSHHTLSGAHLVYRWRLSFDVPVQVTAITMTGFGDNSGNSQMRLLDSSHNVIGAQALTGTGNTPTTTVLSPTATATGQVFYYEEYDSSTDDRYRSFLGATFQPVSP